MGRIFRVVAFSVSLSLSQSSHASWLSEITGIDINIPAGTVRVNTPKPQAIPQMLQNLPKDVGQALLNPAGAALATAIRQAAAQARSGAQPLPSTVRATLAPYFAPHILDKVRWNVYDPNRIAIDSAVIGWFQNEGAITLDIVVVFSDRNMALTDWQLWAHELTHVMQYDNMGVESFANVYSVNWDSLESQARNWASTVAQRVNQGGQVAQQSYSYASTGGAPQLTSANYASAAKAFYPAQSCAQTRESPQALWVANVCPVPILVVGWQQRNPFNGFVASVNCAVNCIVGPGQNMPFQSPAPGPMVNVFFRY